MKPFLIIIFYLLSFKLSAQFRTEIETDSSHIEIIRNSLYRVYTEEYKDKDSTFYEVRFIDDTTKINVVGWQSLNEEKFGIWKEFKRNGEILYKHNYDDNSITFNESSYPYFNYLQKIKQKADSILIKQYSQSFFDNNIRLNYDFSSFYVGKWKYFPTAPKQKYYGQESGGNWKKPVEQKPNTFLFRYDVKIKDGPWNNRMIMFELDSLGNFLKLKPNKFEGSGFEKLTPDNKEFKITKARALAILEKKGLASELDTSHTTENLKWSKNEINEGIYTGRFIYVLRVLASIDKEKSNHKTKLTYHFREYSFNPWTEEFLGIEKYKQIRTNEENHGHTSPFLKE